MKVTIDLFVWVWGFPIGSGGSEGESGVVLRWLWK